VNWNTKIISVKYFDENKTTYAEVIEESGKFSASFYGSAFLRARESCENLGTELLFFLFDNDDKTIAPCFDTLEEAQIFAETNFSNSIQFMKKVVEESIRGCSAWCDKDGNLWIPYYRSGHEDFDVGIFCPKLDKTINGFTDGERIENLSDLVPR